MTANALPGPGEYNKSFKAIKTEGGFLCSDGTGWSASCFTEAQVEALRNRRRYILGYDQP